MPMNNETHTQDFRISPKAGDRMRGRRSTGFLDFAVGGILILMPLLLAGCHASRKAAQEPVKSAEPEVVVTAPEAPKRVYRVMSFDGEVEGISVSGQLRMATDSAMWLSVNKIIEVGRAMCTTDSLWLRAPLLGRDDAMDYATLRRVTGVAVSYDDLQQIALSDDAEERITAIAAKLGFSARVRITRRREVEQLSFPYPKPIKP